MECAFGVVKNRFTCINKVLRVKTPEFAAKIIMTCLALHNFLVMANMRNGEEDPEENEGLNRFQEILDDDDIDPNAEIDIINV